MEPVEINAGGYYLRQPRAEAQLDDRQALVEAFADPDTWRYRATRIPDTASAADYIDSRMSQWHADQRYTWVVAQQNTGRLLAELALSGLDLAGGYAELSCWTHPRHRAQGVPTATIPALLRFAHGAVELHHISYRHAAGDAAARRVAEKCGFTLDGRLREATVVDGAHDDLLVWSHLSSD